MTLKQALIIDYTHKYIENVYMPTKSLAMMNRQLKDNKLKQNNKKF